MADTLLTPLLQPTKNDRSGTGVLPELPITDTTATSNLYEPPIPDTRDTPIILGPMIDEIAKSALLRLTIFFLVSIPTFVLLLIALSASQEYPLSSKAQAEARVYQLQNMSTFAMWVWVLCAYGLSPYREMTVDAFQVWEQNDDFTRIIIGLVFALISAILGGKWIGYAVRGQQF